MKTLITYLCFLSFFPVFGQTLTCTVKASMNNEPLAGIVVELTSSGKNQKMQMQSTTNDKGVVVFDSLPKGSYRLTCKHPDWSGNTYLISMGKNQSKQENILLDPSLEGQLKQFKAITTTEGILQGQMTELGKTAVDIKDVMTPEELYNFKKYLVRNLRYPQASIEQGTEGTVIFLVKMDENNQILQLAFHQQVEPEMDAEAFRVIATMPANLFKKPTEAGEYFYLVPVRFKLG
jgi:hypothetical protein